MSRCCGGFAPVLVLLGTIVCSDHVQAQDPRTIVAMVRRDFSDCGNSDVSDVGTPIGGTAAVTQNANGTTTVAVALRGTPNTVYHFFLKCVVQIGDIWTNSTGLGSASFSFATNSVGPAYAFDAYPDGAPSGNKFQSVQVDFNQPAAGTWKLGRVTNNSTRPISLALPLAAGETADATSTSRLKNLGIAVPTVGVLGVDYKGPSSCRHPRWRAHLSFGERAWEFYFDTDGALDITIAADGTFQFGASGTAQVVSDTQPAACR